MKISSGRQCCKNMLNWLANHSGSLKWFLPFSPPHKAQRTTKKLSQTTRDTMNIGGWNLICLLKNNIINWKILIIIITLLFVLFNNLFHKLPNKFASLLALSFSLTLSTHSLSKPLPERGFLRVEIEP